MTELEFLKHRLSVQENFLAETVEAFKAEVDPATPLWSALNVAKGRAALQFQELQREFERQQSRIQVAK